MDGLKNGVVGMAFVRRVIEGHDLIVIDMLSQSEIEGEKVYTIYAENGQFRLSTTTAVDVSKATIGSRIDSLVTGNLCYALREITGDESIDWFSLESTMDPSTREILEQHRMLLGKHIPQDDTERLRLESLLRQRFGSFLDTSLERLAWTAVMQYHGETDQRKPLTLKERKRLQETMKRLLLKMKENASKPRPKPITVEFNRIKNAGRLYRVSIEPVDPFDDGSEWDRVINEVKTALIHFGAEIKK